jgi:hypothetical protein
MSWWFTPLPKTRGVCTRRRGKEKKKREKVGYQIIMGSIEQRLELFKAFAQAVFWWNCRCIYHLDPKIF